MIHSGATFSEDRAYRRSLWRVWNSDLPALTIIMLNPSKAGETESDPTVSRQIERAKRLGCGGLFVVNAFDLVATDPRDMKRHPEPNSAENDKVILTAATVAVSSGGYVIAAWGANATHRNRHREMMELLKDVPLYALKLTQAGIPSHPLYLSYDIMPFRLL